MQELIEFHDWSLTFLILIVILVSYIRFIIINRRFINGLLNDDQELEILWTVVPFFILIALAIPSLKILYRMEEVRNPVVTLQATGHQWYWTYNYFLFLDSFKRLETEGRYILDNYSDRTDKIRLLETESRVLLPVCKDTRVLCSSDDVLHAWGVRCLGVKVDAVPGRINQLNFLINKPGVYYGNCMELCGAQHRFMPITLEVINMRDFCKHFSIYHDSIYIIINLRFIENFVLWFK